MASAAEAASSSAEAVLPNTASSSQQAAEATTDFSEATLPAPAATSFEAALNTILIDSSFAISSPRVLLAKECATLLLQKSREDSSIVRDFAIELGTKLTSIVSRFNTTKRSQSKQREKLWRSFYQYRSTELPRLWNDFLVKMELENYKDPWLVQTASRIIIENIIKCILPVPERSDTLPPVDADEHIALRYVAGYIFYTLKARYKERRPTLASWLCQQVDDTVNADSFHQFTKLWVRKVNRGGLFQVNDCTFEAFLAMEAVVRQYLHGCTDGRVNKEECLEALQEDNEVQFHWSLLASDLEEKDSHFLLQEIVKLLMTIRGFSYASGLVEEYKRAHDEALKQKKALRKDLKKKADLKKQATEDSSSSIKSSVGAE